MLSLSWRPTVSLLSLDLEIGLASNLILKPGDSYQRKSNEKFYSVFPPQRTWHPMSLRWHKHLRRLIGSILQAKRKEKAEILNSPQWMFVSESCCISTHLALLESCRTLEVSIISKLIHTSGFSTSPQRHCIHCNTVNAHTHLVRLLRRYSILPQGVCSLNRQFSLLQLNYV